MAKITLGCFLFFAFSILFSSASFADNPDSSSYRGVYLGDHQNGLWGGAEWRKRPVSWVHLEASAGFGLGIKKKGSIEYTDGSSENIELTSTVLPRAGASAFFSIPYDMLSWLGVGLGLEGYYNQTKIRPLDPENRWNSKVSGFDYNFTVPLIKLGLETKSKDEERTYLLEFDSLMRFGGKRQTGDVMIPGYGKTGILLIRPLSGIFYGLNLHVLFRQG